MTPTIHHRQNTAHCVTATRPCVCDFCGLPHGRRPAALFECRGFVRSIPGLVTLLYRPGLWAACQHCAPLVRARRWRPIVDRVVAEHQRQHPHADAYELAIARSEHAATMQVVGRHLIDPTPAGGAA